MHFGKNATELRLYPSRGMSYQKIPEAAMSPMVLHHVFPLQSYRFLFATNNHLKRSYLETAQMSGTGVILGQAHVQGLVGLGGAMRRARQNSRT